MPRYDELRTLTFEIDRALGEPLLHRFHAMQFPERWKRPLRELSCRNGDTDQGYIPIRSLNAGIRAVVPDIISTAKKAPEEGARAWLYSSHPVDPAAIGVITGAWVRTAYGKADVNRRLAALSGMPATDLTWTSQEIDLNAWQVGDKGPAEVFTLLPDLLAAQLSRPGTECVLDETVLRFRRAPHTGDDKSRAEVMSWPPLIHTDHRNRPWAYSFVVSFTVQTIPFHPKPVIHCDIGLRRWASERVYLPGGEETSVYLLSKVPWLEGVHQSHAFQVAPIKWVPLGKGEGGDGRRGMLAWGDAVAPLLDELSLRAPLPSPESLRDNPLAALNIDGTPSAAVVYRNAMGGKHGVGAGVTVNDRRSILEWLTAELGPYVRATQPLHRVAITRPRPRRAIGPSANAPTAGLPAVEAQRARRLAIARTTGGVLSVDILYQSSAMLRSLLDTMQGDLGLPKRTPDDATPPMRWETPELTVIARSWPLGPAGAPLEIDTTGPRREYVGRAIDARADEICRLFGGEAGTAALVELGGPDEYARDTDPKDAIRLGCARNGAVSQFITPDGDDGDQDDGISHKAKHAWLDLVRRQLGVQMVPPRIVLPGVEMPHPVHYVGIWLVKQFSTAHRGGMQHQVPVMVKLSSDSLDILATAPGLQGWLPYPQALRALAQCDPFVIGRRDDGQVMHFIKDAMENDVLPLGDVLLLTEAQNLRSTWKYLANNQLDRDRLTFGAAKPQPIRDWLGLRHVRIRTVEGSETPECFAINGDEYGFSAGLWAADPMGRVFASTGRKPSTFKQSAHVSKVRSYSTSKTSSGKRPNLHAWNHQLVEITVAAIQPGDTAWAWAALAHELRSAAPHHNEMTTLPLPLHLAMLMGEYVIPLVT
jgi:pPIWI_RE module N-terminal domain/RNaseH domain of pPIWI_RE/MID domain of pPIWI_RE